MQGERLLYKSTGHFQGSLPQGERDTGLSLLRDAGGSSLSLRVLLHHLLLGADDVAGLHVLHDGLEARDGFKEEAESHERGQWPGK